MVSRSLIFFMLGTFVLATSTGCETCIGGGSCASGYSGYGDVIYFDDGPEFKLSREAAAEEELKAQDDPRDSDTAP